MQQALLLQPLSQHPSAAPATWPYQRFYDSASGSPAGGGPVSDSPPLGPAPARLYQIKMLDFQGRLRKPNLDGGLEVKGQVRGNKVYIVLRSPQRVMAI